MGHSWSPSLPRRRQALGGIVLVRDHPKRGWLLPRTFPGWVVLHLHSSWGPGLHSAHTLLTPAWLPATSRGLHQRNSHLHVHFLSLVFHSGFEWHVLVFGTNSHCLVIVRAIVFTHRHPIFHLKLLSLNCCSPAHRDPLIATTVSVTLSYATARLWPFVTKPLETTQVVANGVSSGPGVSCSAVLTLLCVVPASGTTAACWTPRLPAQESWPLPLCTAHALRLTQ